MLIITLTFSIFFRLQKRKRWRLLFIKSPRRYSHDGCYACTRRPHRHGALCQFKFLRKMRRLSRWKYLCSQQTHGFYNDGFLTKRFFKDFYLFCPIPIVIL